MSHSKLVSITDITLGITEKHNSISVTELSPIMCVWIQIKPDPINLNHLSIKPAKEWLA